MNMQLQPHAAQRSRGFTLIELMVVVAVVAILAAIAYPSYINQVRKSRRADAKSALLDLATRQERFFSTQNTYTNNAANLGYSAAFPQPVLTSGQAYYQIDVTAASATGFTLTASPLGDQQNDPCGSYVLDQLGTQSNSANTLSSAECW